MPSENATQKVQDAYNNEEAVSLAYSVFNAICMIESTETPEETLVHLKTIQENIGLVDMDLLLDMFTPDEDFDDEDTEEDLE